MRWRGGQFVHVLACEGMDGQAEEVLVLRWAGGEETYPLRAAYGLALPGALGATLFVPAAMFSGSLGVMIVPVLRSCSCIVISWRGERKACRRCSRRNCPRRLRHAVRVPWMRRRPLVKRRGM